jgi:GTPase Era involved in 16S rRNA processing
MSDDYDDAEAGFYTALGREEIDMEGNAAPMTLREKVAQAIADGAFDNTSVDNVMAVVVEWLREHAAYYPADIFTDQGKTPDGIAGTTLREMLTMWADQLESETTRPQ